MRKKRPISFSLRAKRDRLFIGLRSMIVQNSDLHYRLSEVIKLCAKRGGEDDRILLPEFQEPEIAEAIRLLARIEGRLP